MTPWIKVGETYHLPSSPRSRYLVLKTDGQDARLQNRVTGWTMLAHRVALHEDGSIEWDYSTDGHFEEVRT